MKWSSDYLFVTLVIALLMLRIQPWDTARPDTCTIECRYNSVHFIMILHTALWWQGQNMCQTLTSQLTPHTSPSWARCRVSFMRILEKTDRVLTSLHCISFACTGNCYDWHWLCSTFTYWLFFAFMHVSVWFALNSKDVLVSGFPPNVS